MIGLDLEVARELAGDAVAHSRERGLVWAEGFASSIDGIVRTVAGDVDAAHASYTRALEVQQQLADDEGAGLSLGGLAQLAAMRGDLSESLDLYRRSLDAFEAIGDRAEEARILSEMAWTHLRDEDTTLARRYFLDSVQAYTDVASVRGVGLSLIGLAATETVEGKPENAVQIAAAAEIYAQQEGIVNVYSDETPGREFVDQARAVLSSGDAERASEAGRRLTIKEALDLARGGETA
jgi:tetratricopeptide (TPR) repeat protein